MVKKNALANFRQSIFISINPYTHLCIYPYKRKFRNFRNSSKAIARLSDLICTEHQLSVITNPQRGSSAYNKWHGFKGKPSHRELLRIAIDEALEQKPHDFDAFLALLAEQGFNVKKGKHLTFTHADFKQNIFDLMNFTKHSCFCMTNLFDILKKNYILTQGVGENGGYHAQILMSRLFSEIEEI